MTGSKPGSTSTGPYGKQVGTIHRSLEVLELFATAQAPLTVGEVCAQLGFPQSSTSLLLHGLVGRGYLTYDRTGRTFFPTVRVAFLGMWLQLRILRHGGLLEFMETLARRSGHVALMAVQNGLHAQYMHIESARQSRVGLRPGLLRPICRAAVGKALLTTKSNDEIRRIVRAINASTEDKNAPIQVDALLSEIQEARRTGFAFSCDSVTVGSSVIATLLPTTADGTPVAVGIGVHTKEFAEVRSGMINLLNETIANYFVEETGSER